ncbi:RALGDS [Bugula neritina]|uniref:RALGDS n=1 Tax=Bugula neritina TaxID=10212 RepID=A0A7J7K8T3_BUGNE|nr:RALGDS [Bugula neritina]
MNPAENNSSLQFLKEFETPEHDAVYNVYLKKLSYNASRATKSDDIGVASVNFKTKELKVIKAGTLDRLLDSLFLEGGEIDGTYVRIFLATFRSFCTPKTLTEKLAQMYEDYDGSEKARSATFQQSIISVLSIWLDLYLQDFNEPPSYPCLQALRSFLKKNLPNSDLFNRVQHRFSKFCTDDDSDDGVCVDSVDCADGRYVVHGRTLPSPSKHGELIESVEFSQLNIRTIAEQLTRIDADLFIKLEAHQCLGSTWNQRSKDKANECPTVAATISMFNSVIFTVISTILKDIDLKASKRARVIEKWIYIAQELRILKNFSSLRAIISGLQSSPIFRLKKLWAHVNKEMMEIYTDLAQIFSLESNQIASRELLMKEGTAKVSTQTRRKSKTNGVSDAAMYRYDQSSLCCGTVPYLGTFLSDLTMVDSAFSDYTDSGLVNFEKHRKEFEIVAQINLFQSAAKMYQVEPHRRFCAWFNSMRVYTEDESYALSCEIEPPSTAEKNLQKTISKTSVTSYASLALSYSNFSLKSPTPSDGVSIGSASSDSAHPITSQSSISSGDSDGSHHPDRRVIKVTLLTPGSDDVNYKSMILTNKDRSMAVIKRVLEKFHEDPGVNHDPSTFCLVQLTGKHRELQFPSDANVFYAMDTTSPNSTFLVKKTSERTPKKMFKTKSFS